MDGDDYLRKSRAQAFRLRTGRPRYRNYGQFADTGEGVEYDIDGDFLVLRLNMRRRGLHSASGKTQRVANTNGQLAVETLECAKGHDIPRHLVLAVNLYRMINPIEDLK